MPEALAATFIGLRQLGGAREVLEAALRIDPAKDALEARLAEVMINQKQPGEALAMLDRNPIRRGLPNARVLNARGEALAAQARWPEGAIAFEAATKINPIAPGLQVNLSSCYLPLENSEAALGLAVRSSFVPATCVG